MNLTALSAFSDHYICMLDDRRTACVVDPGESAPVERALAARGLTLATILVTHHHAGHVGGVDALRALLGGSVYGPTGERIPAPFIALAEGDQVPVPGRSFRVADTPAHSAGDIAFFADAAPDEAPLSFCGDACVCCGPEYTLANLAFARAAGADVATLDAYAARHPAERAALRPPRRAASHANAT